MRDDVGQNRINSQIQSALEAMNVDELRSSLREILLQLDRKGFSRFSDMLLTRASQAAGGWRAAKPARKDMVRVMNVIEVALKTGYTEPDQINDCLYLANQAYLAREYQNARVIFAALLPPLFDGEIDVGQYELISEILTVDEDECVNRWLVSVYMRTPIETRAGEIFKTLKECGGVREPLARMERTALEALPDFDIFLRHWDEYLKRLPHPATGRKVYYENDTADWRREAIGRLEGVDGLERHARKTREYDDLDVWCREVVRSRESATSPLEAYEISARLVKGKRHRATFLDRAARIAQELGAKDVPVRLKAAWIAEPNLTRLVRLLGSGDVTKNAIRRRIPAILKKCPKKAHDQLALLYLLSGRPGDAARLLTRAPGLGWSLDNHPGHIVFRSFAGLLARDERDEISLAVFEELSEIPWSLDVDSPGNELRFSTPSVHDLVFATRSGNKLKRADRAIMLASMQTATEHRLRAILGEKHRRYYDQVAMFMACCVELAPQVGRENEFQNWFLEIKREFSRFSAFQQELGRIMQLKQTAAPPPSANPSPQETNV